MSYDIFFVRRDPGQTFEDALESVEDSYEGGDPGPLSEDELEQWEELLPRAHAILGPQAEVTQDGAEARELTDPDTGIGLTLIQGEYEIHVPESSRGRDSVELMSAVYQLARAVELVTGLEGYDPQLGEPVSDAVPGGPGRAPRVPAGSTGSTGGEDEDRRSGAAPGGSGALGSAGPPAGPRPTPVPRRRWWEFWKP